MVGDDAVSRSCCCFFNLIHNAPEHCLESIRCSIGSPYRCNVVGPSLDAPLLEECECSKVVNEKSPRPRTTAHAVGHSAQKNEQIHHRPAPHHIGPAT